MSEIAQHEGVVERVSEGEVWVRMNVVSACATCEGHDKCAFVEQTNKTVAIKSDRWERYTVGEQVTVRVREELGLLAVLLAYVVPALILIGGILLLVTLTGSELLGATLPILLVGVYYAILYINKKRLSRKFSFGISE